jgi:short-chain fatty acids transporter
MIRMLGGFFSALARRWLPDAFLFAIILTVIVIIAGIIGESKSPVAMIAYWGEGFWSLLQFSMQMVLILVTGHVLAMTTPVKRVLDAIAAAARTPGQAIMLVTLVALAACWINWGFGLIVGALMARELAGRVRGIHYPLLVAAAYTGFLVWHAGLSGSIPLKLAAPGTDALSQLTKGIAIPVAETIFAWQTLVPVVVLFVSLPLLNRLMMPKADETTEIDGALLAEEVRTGAATAAATTPAEKLENSAVLSLVLGVLGLAYLAYYFFLAGGTLGLDSVNFIFLFLGILLHRTPINYLRALNQAIRGAGGIVLQFPLYAGIMGMMVKSGLAVSISQWFVDISTAQTFPLFTFLSAGVVNIFVPSGGGQWAVQGPIVMPAAEALGVAPARAAMAIAFGDAWTNMIQPFWALPLLAIAGLGIRDIMGYCIVALLWSGVVIGLSFLFL